MDSNLQIGNPSLVRSLIIFGWDRKSSFRKATEKQTYLKPALFLKVKAALPK